MGPTLRVLAACKSPLDCLGHRADIHYASRRHAAVVKDVSPRAGMHEASAILAGA